MKEVYILAEVQEILLKLHYLVYDMKKAGDLERVNKYQAAIDKYSGPYRQMQIDIRQMYDNLCDDHETYDEVWESY